MEYSELALYILYGGSTAALTYLAYAFWKGWIIPNPKCKNPSCPEYPEIPEPQEGVLSFKQAPEIEEGEEVKVTTTVDEKGQYHHHHYHIVQRECNCTCVCECQCCACPPGGSGSGSGSGSGGYGSGSGSGGSGSGSGNGSGGSCGVSQKNKINLIRKPDGGKVIGTGFHRSGWIVAVKALEKYDSPDGILFDDFVEQNFCHKAKPKVYTCPWVGIFHHPQGIPYYGSSHEMPENYLLKPEFVKSAKNLKLAIALTEYHAEFLRKYLDCPVVAVKHPTLLNFPKWSLGNWKVNPDKSLIQLGYYLRNTQVINQVPDIPGLAKKRLWTNTKWICDFDKRVQRHFANKRASFSSAEDLTFQMPSKFDKLLSSNLVIMEFLAASAANGVLDCVARGAPIFVNPHPAVVEYLGKGYPLYFNDPAEIPALMSKIYDANKYLKNKIDLDELNPDFFASSIVEHVNTVIGE